MKGVGGDRVPQLIFQGGKFSWGYVIKMAWPREESTYSPKACSKLTRTLSVRVVIDSPSTQIISVTK